MAISQIIRFSLSRSSAAQASFRELRNKIARQTFVKVQYYGYIIPGEGTVKPDAKDTMCWFIEWCSKDELESHASLMKDLNHIASNPARCLEFDFTETKAGGVLRALEAPVCEFAIIKLSEEAPRGQAEFEKSMHKTFTDSYFDDEFVDGGWGYSLSCNDADGNAAGARTEELPESQRKLAFYPLGWKNLEAHHAYAKTKLFDEEINKLKPYFVLGTGAFYVEFEKHEGHLIARDTCTN